MTNSPAQEVLMLEGPGRRLREARSALNLSRQDVARELRLKQELIAALEEDDIDSLPAPIYVTGYLRNYARLLRIPSEPLIDAYRHLHVEAPAIVSDIVRPHEAHASRRLVRWVSIGLFILLLAGFVSWLQKQDFAWLGNITPPPAVTSEGGAVVEPAELPAVPAKPPVDETPLVSPVAPTSGLLQEPAGAAATPQPPAVSVTTPAPAAVAGKTVAIYPDRVVLRMAEDCWAEVTDAEGRRLVYDLVRAGTSRDERGTAPFQVFLGNATGVSMEVNGHAYDFSEYVHGNLARFTVTTDET